MPSCPIHGLEMALKPGGISRKSGKPYNPFYACPWKDQNGYCSKTANVAPSQATSSAPAAAPAGNEMVASAMMAKLERIEAKLDQLLARQAPPAPATPPPVEEVAVEDIPF